MSLKDDVLLAAEMHYLDHQAEMLRVSTQPVKALRRRWIYTGPKKSRRTKGWQPEPWRHIEPKNCPLCKTVEALIEEEGQRLRFLLIENKLPWDRENHDCVVCPQCKFAFAMIHTALEGDSLFECPRCGYPNKVGVPDVKDGNC